MAASIYLLRSWKGLNPSPEFTQLQYGFGGGVCSGRIGRRARGPTQSQLGPLYPYLYGIQSNIEALAYTVR